MSGRITADEMVRATAQLPSELTMEYVSQESPEGRMTISLDVHSCQVQDLGARGQFAEDDALASSTSR